MEKLIELNTDANILVSSTILNFDKPEYIYIPISLNSEILVHQGELVKIGTPIIKNSKEIITSSISGKVTAIKKVETIKGHADAIEIMNDFEENKIIEAKTKRTLKRLKKEELNNVLARFNICLENKKNLILNCIDDEPYVLSESFYLLFNHEEFLELLDVIDKIYHLETITIAIKSSNSININKLMDNLGMYPNITLNIVPNLYLIGKEEFLLKRLGFDKNDTCTIKSSIFYHINNKLKRNKTITDELITISGNNLENPSVIKVKIGSKLKDIITNLIIEKENSLYIGNGLMQGEKIDIENFIITKDFKSLLIMSSKDFPKESKCINCGACIDICPVNLYPLLLKNKDYRDKVKDICLKCGLCSYICPSYINFNNEIKGDSNE